MTGRERGGGKSKRGKTFRKETRRRRRRFWGEKIKTKRSKVDKRGERKFIGGRKLAEEWRGKEEIEKKRNI